MFSDMTSFLKDKWMRPAGAREVVRLAVPMIISSGSVAIMQFTDRVFLTWYDTTGMALGAAFTAGCLFWLLVAFPFQITSYCNAFVSQYNGSRQYERIAPIVWQGFFLGFVVMPVMLAFAPWYSLVFAWFGHSRELIVQEDIYLYWSVWGIAPLISCEALVAFFCGRKKMKTVMAVNMVFVLVNVVLNYFLIFGLGPWCRWGLAGAAIATSIAQWLRLATFLVLIFREDRRTGLYHFWRSCRLNRRAAMSLFGFGSMAGFQATLDIWAFSLIILMIGRLGDHENAATAVAFTLNNLTFLPILGAGVAVVSLVGNYLGENRADLARRATYSAFVLGGAFAGVFVVLFCFCPDLFLYVYAKNDPVGFEPIRNMTIVLLRYVALYLFFDTSNIIFCSAIKGAGDTRYVLIVTCILTPVITLLVLIGIPVFDFGLHWCWSIATGWTFALAFAYFIRFYRGKWMKMRLFSEQNAGHDASEPIQ